MLGIASALLGELDETRLRTTLSRGLTQTLGEQNKMNLFAERHYKLHIDSHVPNVGDFGRDFDAEATAGLLAESGFEWVQICAKCIYGNSYYFTHAGIRHPGLKTDMFGEMAEALARRGIAVIAYYSLIPDANQSRLHPEWRCYRDGLSGLGVEHVSNSDCMCLRSAYLNEIALPQLREIILNYPVSGIFFDFARSYGYCGCRNCQEAFRRETGLELPEKSPDAENWSEYIAWKKQEQNLFEEKIQRLREELKKDFSFTVNYSHTIRNPEAGVIHSDYTTMDVMERGEHCGLNVGFNVRYLATTNRPAEVMTTRMIDWWTSWGLKPFQTLLYQNAMIQAHNVESILGDRWDLSWRSSPEVMRYFRKLNDFIRDYRNFTDGARVYAPAAILNYRPDMLRKNRTPSNDTVELLGPMEAAHKILTHNHIPCLIIDEENLVRYLDDLKLLVVPEQRIPDGSPLIPLLRRFLENDGVLIGSGEIILEAETAALFQVRRTDEFSRGFFVLNPQYAAKAPFGMGEIPFKSRFLKFRCEGQGDLIAESCPTVYGLDESFGFGPIDREKAAPGIFGAGFGSGWTVYCGAEVFSGYRKYNTPQFKHLLGEIVRHYAPETILSSDAPDSVEFSLMRNTDSVYVNCFHFSPEKDFDFRCSYLDQSACVDCVMLHLPWSGDAPQLIRRFCSSLPPVEFKLEDGQLHLVIRSLPLFDSIRIERKGA